LCIKRGGLGLGLTVFTNEALSGSTGEKLLSLQ